MTRAWDAYAKTCQDQRLNRVNKLGPSWPVSTERVWGELTLSLSKMADGSDREVTQADQNDINSQWSLFFTDLDELLSEYEQHRSTNDFAITENLIIRLENAVRALQNVSHFVSPTAWYHKLTRKQFSNWPGISS